MPRLIKERQYWYIGSGDVYICILWVEAVLSRANGFVWPADSLLWEKENPWHGSVHENGDFWGMAFPKNRLYMHRSFKRKVGLVGFTRVLSYLNSEWVCIHLHILQPLWKSDLETSNTSLWTHFRRNPEEDERWVRRSHNGVGLVLVWGDHDNNASEAYLVCLQVCLQICIRGEARLMTPFCCKVGKYLL